MYGSPQMEQNPPSWTGEPQFGHFRTSDSPHIAQNFPPTGSAAERSGLRKSRPSTLYAWFVGQCGFGQKPLAGTTKAISGRESSATASELSAASRLIPNFFASFATVSSLSLVPSPCSNIDNAGCLQPTSAAIVSCESFAAFRALRIFMQISGLSLFTVAYYGLYFINFQAHTYKHYKHSYQLINRL